MRRAYKFLLRPTARQAAALAACLEDHRQLYNAALAERREAYRRARITTQADFRCVACGYAGHADVVGATNVLRAGLVLQAATAA